MARRTFASCAWSGGEHPTTEAPLAVTSRSIDGNGIMNETEFAASRGTNADQPGLSIITTNRRFVICTLVGAAILLLTLTGAREIENIPAYVRAPSSALKSQPAPPALRAT